MSEQDFEAKRPVGRPRIRPPKPITYLNDFGPVEKEKIALWLSAYLPALEFQIGQVSSEIMSGRDFPGASNQLLYNRTKYAVLQELAWIVRTSRGGPLGGEGRRKKSEVMPPAE